MGRIEELEVRLKAGRRLGLSRGFRPGQPLCSPCGPFSTQDEGYDHPQIPLQLTFQYSS